MYLYVGYYYLLILSSLFYGAVTVRRGSPLSFRLLLWWLIATVPTEVTATVLGRLYHDNHWVYLFWEPFDCFMVLLIFYHGMKHGVTKRVCMCLLALALVGFFIFSLPHFLKLTWNRQGMLFYLFCELVGACLFLTDGLLPGEELSIFKQPIAWVAFGVILYSCMYILIHALWEYIATWPRGRYQLLTDIANTFEYAGVAAAFYALRRKPR